jgi:hypothetical protein
MDITVSSRTIIARGFAAQGTQAGLSLLLPRINNTLLVGVVDRAAT